MATNYFRIEAPYPALASTVLLPSPEIGNNEGLLAAVRVIKMEDGSRRSFVQNADMKRRYRWTFILSHDKMEEFSDFVERYRGSKFKCTWRERTFIGKVAINPVEFVGEGRAYGWPGDEAYQVTIELVETK
jgi:hypothetical protein